MASTDNLPGGWVAVYPAVKMPQGGQGIVTKVQHPDREGHFVLKRLRKSDRADRFEKEIQQMDELFSRGAPVPEIIDSGIWHGKSWYVMPWYENGSLENLIGAERRPDTLKLINLLAEIGEAIRFVHDAGVSHRDIKPGNILLGPDGPLLADFGLCRHKDDPRLTGPFEDVGPKRYTAPENQDGINESGDQRSADCYAYGKLCWSVLTGRPALSGERQLEPEQRLDVLLGDPSLKRFHRLFQRLLARSDERLTDWEQILREVRGDGDNPSSAGAFEPVDLESLLSLAEQVVDPYDLKSRQQAEKLEVERREMASELWVLINQIFSDRLANIVRAINERAARGLHFQLGPGREVSDHFDEDLIAMIDTDRADWHFLNMPPPGGLLMSKWGDSDGKSTIGLMVVLARYGDEVKLIRVPMKRQDHYEYLLPALDLKHFIDESDVMQLGFEDTVRRVTDFAQSAAQLGERMIGRYLKLTVAGESVADGYNWEGLS
ncbi:serine/threonine protein kinase [Micromonospora marina]|uniref:serine/threonine protein kinase n=1 Tax=Micromonospora marina TaxID=307120 RepID=UPI0034531221